MDNDVLVSVILPTFNRAPTLPEAIGSVLAQTLREIELIVVDDASTDNTIALVESYGDPRIRIIKNAVRTGVSKARNVGIASARGVYVAFQDSDDVWLPSKLDDEISIMRASSGKYGLVFSDHIRNNNGRYALIPEADAKIDEEDMYSQLLIRNFISTQTLLTKLDLVVAIGGFDERLPRYVDWDLVLRLSKIAKFSHINRVGSLVNVSRESITTNKDIDYVARESIYKKYKDDLVCRPEAHLAHLIGLSRSAMSISRITAGLYWSLLAVFLFPARYRSWVSMARTILYLPVAVCCRGSGM
ncbi:MAG: glycosyltransferase [Formivibrio sp.]|nr:glycosyltransferase [Formivibrio sp.]